MDWIEQLFGVSPDAGSGALEVLLPLALVVALVGIALAATRAVGGAASGAEAGGPGCRSPTTFIRVCLRRRRRIA